MDGGVYARARSGWRGIGALLGESLTPFAYFHLFFTTLDDDTDPDPEMSAILCTPIFALYFTTVTLLLPTLSGPKSRPTQSATY